jgi:hypothetical protein
MNASTFQRRLRRVRSASTRHRTLAVISRFVAALYVGYQAMVGLVAVASIALVLAFGMPRAEALMLTAMIGVLGYAAIILWSFAEPKLGRVWLALGTAAIVSHVAAAALAKWLPPLALRPWAYVGA